MDRDLALPLSRSSLTASSNNRSLRIALVDGKFRLIKVAILLIVIQEFIQITTI